jgi:hypothetical protein
MVNWLNLTIQIFIWGSVTLGVILLIAGFWFAWFKLSSYLLKRRYSKDKDNGRRFEDYPGDGTTQGTSRGFGADSNVSERGILSQIASAISGESGESPIDSAKPKQDSVSVGGEIQQPRGLKLFSKN